MSRLLAVLLVAPVSAHAAVFNVNTTADIAGVCGLTCSLRQAVGSANANPGPDTIQLINGVYNLTLVGAGENANATGDLDITGPTTIVGPMGGVKVIDGGWNDRIFDVGPAVNLTVRRVHLRNGSVNDLGGAIRSNGNVTLQTVTLTSSRDLGMRNYYDPTGGGVWVAGGFTALGSTFEGNTATHGRGGAVWVGGNATIGGCTFEENQISWGGQGGALFVTGVSTISDSRFSYNSATALPSGTGLPIAVGGGQGGALYTYDVSTITGTDLTWNNGEEGGAWFAAGGATFTSGDISDNDAGTDGGGVFTLFNTLTLDLATVNRNTSASTGGWAITGGGGIFNWYGNIELIDTSLDNNVASGGVGGGLAILSGGGSIVGSTLSENGADAGAAVYVQGNLSGVNSTFSGNISESAEGIIDLWASGGLPVTADFINCTFAQNVTDAAGTPDALSLDAAGGTIKVENTLILDGCLSTLTSADHNLEPANTCGLTQPNDLPSTPIIYGLLFNNGGPTMTHQIGPATAARNAADYATCMGADVGGVDQRGVSRADPLSRCDIGAYEF